MESLGEIIKKALRDKGIKESFVAQKMNLSKQVVNQIDKRKNFDLAFLQELKEVTGLDFTAYIIPSTYKRIEDILELKEPDIDYVNHNPTILSLSFEIPISAYANISAFMESLNSEAEKYGIKVL